jgi:uncharacterized membrane protein YkoI
MTKLLLQTSLVLFATVSFPPAWAFFESNQQLAEDARISMADAITIAEKIIPGKPVHAQIGKDLGHTVYQIEIIDKDKKFRWVYIDATNGSVTEAKR